MELHLKIRRQEEEEDGATLDPEAEEEEDDAFIIGANKETEAESLLRVLKVRARVLLVGAEKELALLGEEALPPACELLACC